MVVVGAVAPVRLTEPDTAPPVDKLVPVHDVALVDDHVMSADWPLDTEVGLVTSDAVTGGP